MKTISIGRGGQMVPLVGFGLWRIANDSCADAVYNAIKAGYRLFDGACGIALLTMLVLMRFADR
jgi:D-xylose reductase